MRNDFAKTYATCGFPVECQVRALAPSNPSVSDLAGILRIASAFHGMARAEQELLLLIESPKEVFQCCLDDRDWFAIAMLQIPPDTPNNARLNKKIYELLAQVPLDTAAEVMFKAAFWAESQLSRALNK